jgi:hypothetical protein
MSRGDKVWSPLQPLGDTRTVQAGFSGVLRRPVGRGHRRKGAGRVGTICRVPDPTQGGEGEQHLQAKTRHRPEAAARGPGRWARGLTTSLPVASPLPDAGRGRDWCNAKEAEGEDKLRPGAWGGGVASGRFGPFRLTGRAQHHALCCRFTRSRGTRASA